MLRVDTASFYRVGFYYRATRSVEEAVSGSPHIFQDLYVKSCWTWHLAVSNEATRLRQFAAGCRGFVGPVPPPLSMRVRAVEEDAKASGCYRQERALAVEFRSPC